MRPHGRATVDIGNQTAFAVCDRCGFLYNHNQLRWQFQWIGPRLQNIRMLVCDPCMDVPQEQLRTIVIPADPIPIMNARPENYVSDNNPLSAIGANATPTLWQFGSQIGTMVDQGGVPAAFNGASNKPSEQCACISVSNSSYNNYVGINWSGNAHSLTAPSSLLGPVLAHVVSAYTIIGPNDRSIGASAYVVQGSPVDAGWGSWTTIASGSISGSDGEVISGTVTDGGRYQFHRVAFLGDGSSPIYVAQVMLSVADGSSQ